MQFPNIRPLPSRHFQFRAESESDPDMDMHIFDLTDLLKKYRLSLNRDKIRVKLYLTGTDEHLQIEDVPIAITQEGHINAFLLVEYLRFYGLPIGDVVLIVLDPKEAPERFAVSLLDAQQFLVPDNIRCSLVDNRPELRILIHPNHKEIEPVQSDHRITHQTMNAHPIAGGQESFIEYIIKRQSEAQQPQQPRQPQQKLQKTTSIWELIQAVDQETLQPDHHRDAVDLIRDARNLGFDFDLYANKYISVMQGYVRDHLGDSRYLVKKKVAETNQNVKNRKLTNPNAIVQIEMEKVDNILQRNNTRPFK